MAAWSVSEPLFFCDIFLIIDALQAVEKVPEFRFLAKEDVCLYLD